MLSKLIGQSRMSPLWVKCVLPVLLALPAIIHAQSTIVLGNSTSELRGPWKFHTGDNPAWAQTDFDDSGWSAMDLTPPQNSHDPYIGSSGFVPGWTARGYPGYSGFAWYRLRVNLQDPVEGGLALKMPNDVDDAYQVYANGRFIGEFGRFSGMVVTDYIAQPRAFTLPAGIGTGPLTIAVRMWMDAHTPLIETAAGGLHGPPVLGQTPIVMAMQRLDWDAVNHSASSGFPEGAILLLALAVALSLFLLDRTETAYLWLCANCIVILLVIFLAEMVFYTTWIPGHARGFFTRRRLASASDGAMDRFLGVLVPARRQSAPAPLGVGTCQLAGAWDGTRTGASLRLAAAGPCADLGFALRSYPQADAGRGVALGYIPRHSQEPCRRVARPARRGADRSGSVPVRTAVVPRAHGVLRVWVYRHRQPDCNGAFPGHP